MGNEKPGAVVGHSRHSSVRMSLSRLFLGRLRSRRACLRFTGWAQNAVQWFCRSRFLQRTAMSVLTVCVNQGDNPNGALQLQPQINPKYQIAINFYSF